MREKERNKGHDTHGFNVFKMNMPDLQSYVRVMSHVVCCSDGWASKSFPPALAGREVGKYQDQSMTNSWDRCVFQKQKPKKMLGRCSSFQKM